MTAPATHRVWIPYLAFTVLFWALLPLYRHLLDPDPISYLSIARLYLAGEWREAVNVHWSPLFSWLVAPLMAFLSPIFASRILGFLSGLITIYAMLRLFDRFELNAAAKRLALAAAVPMVLVFALLRLGPDLGVAALLLIYFDIVFDRGFATAPRAGLMCGVLGGLAFLTKGFAFFFFLMHYLLMCLLHAWRNPAQRAPLIRQYAAGMGAFIVISGIWIALISADYGRLTTSTTGDFNLRLTGRDSINYPQYGRLFPPPTPNSHNFWQEPPPASLPEWKPWASVANATYQVRLVIENTRWLAGHWFEVSLFFAGIVLAYVVWGLNSGQNARVWWLLPVTTFLVYPPAYLLIIIQDRYLWPVTLLLVPFAAVVAQSLMPRLGPLPRTVLTVALFGSFLILPARMLFGYRHTGRQIAVIADQLRPLIPAQSSAVWKGTAASCARWNDSLALAHRLNLQFFGTTDASPEEHASGILLHPGGRILPMPSVDARKQQAAAQLDQFSPNIGYYFAWSTCDSVPESVLAKEELTRGSIPELRVYRLR